MVKIMLMIYIIEDNIFQQVNRELAFWACSQHLTGPFRMQIHDSCDDKQKTAANP